MLVKQGLTHLQGQEGEQSVSYNTVYIITECTQNKHNVAERVV